MTKHIGIVACSAEGAARQRGFGKLEILGTKCLITGPVYPEILEKYGLSYEIPGEEDREAIDTIIFKELVNGIFAEASRRFFNEVIQKLKR